MNIAGRQTPNTEDTKLVSGRKLEIWKPIFASALFFDGKGCALTRFTNSPSPLFTLMLELAIEGAKQRQIEDMTETGETLLIRVLLKLVTKDDYYKVKAIRDEMAKLFDEEQK